jgi:hypothetical protein
MSLRLPTEPCTHLSHNLGVRANPTRIRVRQACLDGSEQSLLLGLFVFPLGDELARGSGHELILALYAGRNQH